MKPQKVGLLGLVGVGGAYLAALESDDRFELVAVADTDLDLLRRHTEGEALRAYEDYRSLVVGSAQTGLDLLFVALEPFQSVDFVEMAARQGLEVFHKAPPARTVGELQRLLDVFSGSRGTLIVSRPWRVEPAYAGLADLDALTGHVYAVTGEVQTTEDAAGWRGDSARAGGGVLLNGAYEQLDMLVTLLGIPESVYTQCSIALAPGVARKYDTEDAAAVSLRFARDRIATLTASRGAAKPAWRLTLVGEKGMVEVSGEGMRITPRGEGMPRSESVQSPHPAAAAIRELAEARETEPRRGPFDAEDHLATMAVVEAAYLSAKTGAPESPARFLPENTRLVSVR